MRTRVLILTLIFMAASVFIVRASRPEPVPIREPISELPMRIGSWEGRQAPDMDSRSLAILGVDDYVNRVYYSPEQFPAGLYIGYYQSQRDGQTIHSPLNCLPGAGWNPVRNDHLRIPIDPGAVIEINRITILKGLDKQVVLYWYQSHGRVVASEYWGKIYTVLDALRTNRTDAALVRVICPVEGNNAASENNAEQHGVDFVKSLYPLLSRFIPD